MRAPQRKKAPASAPKTATARLAKFLNAHWVPTPLSLVWLTNPSVFSAHQEKSALTTQKSLASIIESASSTVFPAISALTIGPYRQKLSLQQLLVWPEILQLSQVAQRTSAQSVTTVLLAPSQSSSASQGTIKTL